MSAPVIDMTAILLARRDQELRQKYRIDPDQTSRPIGFLVEQIIHDCRLKLAERRNRGERL